MVLSIRQLWDPEIVRPRLGAFVDAGVEIDEMPSGFASGLHDQLNVALAVERAGVPDIAVVIDYMDNVGGFAPADALQMNSERRADRATADVKRQGRGLDPEVTGLLAARGINTERMRTAQIVRHIEAELGATLRVGSAFGERLSPP